MRKSLAKILATCLLLCSFSGCDKLLEDSSSSNADSSSCKHTVEVIANETSHCWVYTCGCPSPDIAGLHYDNNEDSFCDECAYLMVETLPLSHILQCLPFEYNREALLDKYNGLSDGYHVIDNAKDYCEFLDDIGVPYEGPFDTIFEENVMLCYWRGVSGTADFIPVHYYYHRESNEIECRSDFQPSPDMNFPAVEICDCIDIVKVPKKLFQKITAE